MFTKRNMKVFLVAFLSIFTAVSLPFLYGSNISGKVIREVTPKLAKVTSPKDEKAIFKEIEKRLVVNPKYSFSLKRGINLAPVAQATGEYNGASAYIVVDLESGKVLAEKRADEKLEMASLTKVMTAVVALDLAIESEEFLITKKAANIEPTKIGVVEGQRMNLNELLNALLLTSANDAAEVIKIGIDHKYKDEVFIRAMNEKARKLGLKNSSFENPQGFDGRAHFSSPADLAKLSHYALKNYPLIEEIVKKDYEFLPADNKHKQFDLYNWNGLLGVYPGTYGVKIGNTDRAGKTTIVAAERDGKNVLVVLLGAPGVLERDYWTALLLDDGFEQLGVRKALVTEQQLKDKYKTWKYWN